MKFLIQENLISTESLDQIKKAIKEIPHQSVKIIPFTDEIIGDNLSGDNYIPYGSTLMTSIAYNKFKWKGLYFDLEKFNYVEAIKKRNDMLNEYMILSLGDAIEFMGQIDQKRELFVRPSSDLKQFSGTVVTAGECAVWFRDMMDCASSGSYKMNKWEKIVIANPRTIQAEWRWFIVGGKVVDGSMYRCDGQLRKKHVVEKDLIKDAQSKADGWIPNSCCVMDTALVNGDFKVIEFNCINSSGFYDNDAETIFFELYQFSKNLM